MNKRRVQAAVIGSGLSGIVAAGRLAAHGVDVCVMDENFHIGGQILRAIPDTLGSRPVDRFDPVGRAGARFIESLKQQKLRVLNRTRVLGIYPGPELLVEENETDVFIVSAETVLLAAGARERFLPFKGWTLPGVLAAGAVQVLIKSSGVLPANQLLIGGTGLFPMAVAYEVLRSRGRVQAILDQKPFLEKTELLGQLLLHPSKLEEGARFLFRIYGSRVPVHYRTRIVEARGHGALDEVVASRVDLFGNPIAGTERIFRTQALAVGYGFVPNIELADLAGCRLEYDAGKGGWVVEVGENLETSCRNVFAAGEITGIAGALKSVNEGEIAALSIRQRLGKIGETEFAAKLKRWNRKRAGHLRFGEHFNSLNRIPLQSLESIPDETIVCRCEDVTIGDVKRAIAEGYDTPESLKLAVRTAMGDCQGRICSPVIYDLLALMTRKSPAAFRPFSVRPPIKPVSIGTLANLIE